MTITEFLLARLDDDEAVARAVEREADTELRAAHEDMSRSDAEMTAWWRRRDLVLHTPGGRMVGATPNRALAEIEAKRRIVRINGAHALDHVERPDLDSMLANWNDFAFGTLCALALPYAGHPDYDEAWTET